jgi:hypothetical protein
MRRALILCLALAGCGSAAELRPARNGALPPAPYGATATPTAQQLMTPKPQQRPLTVDDLLVRSEKRRSDEFSLPPGAGVDASVGLNQALPADDDDANSTNQPQ